MLKAETILRMHDEANARWHRGEDYPPAEDGLAGIALQQHRANFDLWHQEDGARSPDAPDAAIVDAKHAIDGLNQRRNDLVEQMDVALLREAGAQAETAPLHSETPGMIVDRLSILALKIYHTHEEAHRKTADAGHRERNTARLRILLEQREDLAACLDAFWAAVMRGERRFKLYRQMKMYNDPELNPVLYGRAR